MVTAWILINGCIIAEVHDSQLKVLSETLFDAASERVLATDTPDQCASPTSPVLHPMAIELAGATTLFVPLHQVPGFTVTATSAGAVAPVPRPLPWFDTPLCSEPLPGFARPHSVTSASTADTPEMYSLCSPPRLADLFATSSAETDVDAAVTMMQRDTSSSDYPMQYSAGMLQLDLHRGQSDLLFRPAGADDMQAALMSPFAAGFDVAVGANLDSFMADADVDADSLMLSRDPSRESASTSTAAACADMTVDLCVDNLALLSEFDPRHAFL